MIKTLSKHGNSLALVIDKGILDLLKIEPDTPLEITTDGRSLIVTPARSAEERDEMRAALAKVNRRHAKALKRLAE